jgi:hypothetical protein
MGLVLLASALLFLPPDSNVLEVQLDRTQSWPRELTVQRGTVIRLSGKAEGGTPVEFIVKDSGTLVGKITSDHEWALDWSTSQARSGASVLEVEFRHGDEDTDLMARIDVQVLDRSPFAFGVAGTAPNGDVLIKQTSGPGDVKSVSAEFGGRTIPLAAAQSGTYRFPISGIKPGNQHVSFFVVLASKAPFDGGAVDLTVPERVAFKETQPLIVERTPESDGTALRVACTFPDGLVATGVDVDLRPGGVFVPAEKGGQILLAVDELPEGKRSFSLIALGEDKGTYLSRTRDLVVHSNAAYVAMRALQRCKPVIEECATDLKATVAKAGAADLAVRGSAEPQTAAVAWDDSHTEVGAAIDAAKAEEPEGLEQADTTKIVPGLNNALHNWMLYGSLITEAMADSWKSVRIDDFDKFSTESATRSRDLATVLKAVGDAQESRRNLIAAFTRIAEPLPIDRLEFADAFSLGSDLISWIKRRLGLLKVLSDAAGAVNSASSLAVEEIPARARYVRSIQPADVQLSAQEAQLQAAAMDFWGAAVEELARIKMYEAEKARVLAEGGGENDSSDAGQDRANELDQLIRGSMARREADLKTGLSFVQQLIERERAAVTRSQF